MKIYTIWPLRPDGQLGGNWRGKRFAVLDVTRGLDQAILVSRHDSREEAVDAELQLRVEQRQSPKAPR